MAATSDSWSNSSKELKDINSLISENANRFFSSPSKRPQTATGYRSIQGGAKLDIPRPRSGASSPVAKFNRHSGVSLENDHGSLSSKKSIDSSGLLVPPSGKHASSLATSASVPDFAFEVAKSGIYVEEFDPLVPKRADSLEELFQDFNHTAEQLEKDSQKSREKPVVPPRPSNLKQSPPIPRKPSKEDIRRALSTSQRNPSDVGGTKMLKPPALPPRRVTKSVDCLASESKVSSVGIICLQPIERLQSSVDNVKLRSHSFDFAQCNCVADGFRLQDDFSSRINVRFFVDDGPNSPKVPYLEYKLCSLSQTATDLLEFWKESFKVKEGTYFIRFCGCQIFMDVDSAVGNHLLVRKLLALDLPLDVCVKNIDENLSKGRVLAKNMHLADAQSVSWPLTESVDRAVELLEDRNKSIDTVEGRFLTKDNQLFKQFVQSAKILRDFLNIETPELSKLVELLENCDTSQLKGLRQKVISEVLDLKNSFLSSFDYLKYCHPVKRTPVSSQTCSQYFELQLNSISNMATVVSQVSANRMFVDVNVYYNGRKIFLSSARDSWHSVKSKASIRNNQSVTFFDPLDSKVIEICDIPREAVIQVSLYYFSESSNQEEKLASVAFPVFDCNGVLNDCPVFLPLWTKPDLPHSAYTHLNTSTISSPSSTYGPILSMQILNHSFETVIFSSSKSQNSGKSDIKSNEPLSPLRDIKAKRINRIFQNKHASFLLRNPEIQVSDSDLRGIEIKEDCDLIWRYRKSLLTDEEYGSDCLPDILFTNTASWKSDFTVHIPDLISLCCGQISKFAAFTILLYRFSDTSLRQFAVENLNFTTDELIVLIPVLCECLKYEIYVANALIELLLEKCSQSLFFGISLFRSLSLNASIPQFRQLSDVYKAAIAQVCPQDVVQGFQVQDQLASELERFYKDETLEKETVVLRAFLQNVNESLFSDGKSVASFFPPGRTCLGFNIEKCFLHSKSNAKPMHLFLTTMTNYEVEVIYKHGDDLRQDQLMSLLMTFMNSWWLSEGLDLKFISYGVYPCTASGGFIEVVPNAVTLCQLQTTSGGFAGALSSSSIYQWLRQKTLDGVAFEKVLENFSLSTAAYCVATYILGVCDRHNDNVMIMPSGHLFHIDYGRVFGHTQKFGPVNRDRTPFVLTKDMFYAINRSYSDISESYYDFVKTCCKAYNIVRRNADFIIAVVRHMIGGERPEMSREIQFLVQRLQPQLNDDEATQMFTQKINESIDKSIVTSLNFVIHALGQTGLSSARSKRQFDFTQNIVTREECSSEILMVNICGVQQRLESNREKFHVYVCEVIREDSEPNYVFRRWSQFRQLLAVLQNRFPDFFSNSRRRLELTIPQMFRKQFSRLEYRRNSIQCFLDGIFSLGKSTVGSSTELYTFFQSLPEDRNFTLSNEVTRMHFDATRYENEQLFGAKVEMKISCDDRQTQVYVFVKRCIDLTLTYSSDAQEDSLNSANVYVKLKLVHVDDVITAKSPGFKQKTEIKNSSSPIFNQLFTFNVGSNPWESMILEVSACYYQFGTVNSSCVGRVTMPLASIRPTVELEDTFLLC